MADKNRQHKRIDKRVNLRFCVADVFPKKWDMPVVDNISAGGVKFIALSALALNNKTIQLQIRVPELAPLILELEAVVVDVKPRPNNILSDIRVKFINLSEVNKGHLTVLEEIIDLKEAKNTPKDTAKK